MPKLSLLIMGMLVAAGLFAPLHAQQTRQELDRIVALVDDDVILRSELDDAIAQITQQLRGMGENLPPRNVFEEQVLERLVIDKLQVQRAYATGIRVSDSDVDSMLQDVAQRNNISLAQLRQSLEADGYLFNEFRREMHDELMRNRLQRRIYEETQEEVTETEVDILMASEQFGGGEYHLSQILIGVPETATPLEVEEARERAADVVRELEGGMEFSAAAITYSQAADALEGGEVGWRSADALPAILTDALEPLEIGRHTDPIRTPSGFLVLRLNDRRDSREVIVQEFRARHIMVSPSELVSEEDARARIMDIHRQLEEGADFQELAREHSDDDTTANIGGLLDWFPRDAYGPQLTAILDRLEPGEISRPFQMGASWHVLLFEDVREADRTEETVRQEARQMLVEQRAEEEIQRFLRHLRDESFVEIRL